MACLLQVDIKHDSPADMHDNINHMKYDYMN